MENLVNFSQYNFGEKKLLLVNRFVSEETFGEFQFGEIIQTFFPPNFPVFVHLLIDVKQYLISSLHKNGSILFTIVASNKHVTCIHVCSN